MLNVSMIWIALLTKYVKIQYVSRVAELMPTVNLMRHVSIDIVEIPARCMEPADKMLNAKLLT
ncbi:hypothetical protein X975_26663, partial [Stegodyphus mimosarum]